MKTVKIYYAIQDGGDGSAYLKLFRTKEGFDKFEEKSDAYEGFGESCGGSIEFEVDETTGEIIPAKKTEYWSQFQEDRFEI